MFVGPPWAETRAITAAGYTGWVGLEYKPSDPADSAASFGWLPRERRAAEA